MLPDETEDMEPMPVTAMGSQKEDTKKGKHMQIPTDDDDELELAPMIRGDFNMDQKQIFETKFPTSSAPPVVDWSGLTGMEQLTLSTSWINLFVQILMMWAYSVSPDSGTPDGHYAVVILFVSCVYFTILYIGFGIIGHVQGWPILLDVVFDLFGIGFLALSGTFSVAAWGIVDEEYILSFLQYSALLGTLMFVLGCFLGLIHFSELSVSPWYSHAPQNYAMLGMYPFTIGALCFFLYAMSLFFEYSFNLRFWLIDWGLMLFVVGRFYFLFDARRVYMRK